MPPGCTHLFIPGPTNVPEAVRRALNVPMQDHRAPDFPELTLPLLQDLKKVVRTETGRVFLYPSSGTGAWEAALVNKRDREACGAVWLDQPVESYRVNRTIEDGEEIEAGDTRLVAVHTPGHTLGHVSFYAPSEQVLIGGDPVCMNELG